jgi:pimeloyl-ACP methyl ester carboxylesterase
MEDPKWIRKPQGDTAVVFVHGILSRPKSSWRNGDAYWPNLLAQEESLTSLGIYVFFYQTNPSSARYSVSDAADSLALYLKTDGLLGLRRLIFVCHSMGGIVVRRYIVASQNDLRTSVIRVGLFLVASPSIGSEYANWVSAFARAVGHSQAEILRFSQSNLWLNDLDQDFMKLRDDLGIRGRELMEDKFVVLSSIWHKQVVEPFSAHRYFADPLKIAESDHFTIATPTAGTSMQHIALVDFISDFLESTPAPAPAVRSDLKVPQLQLRQVAPTEEPVWRQFEGKYFSVGRGPKNDVVVNDPKVSWDHGVFALERGFLVYRQISGTNPTFIQGAGRQVELSIGGIEEAKLANEDRLTLGSSTFVLKFDPGTDAVYTPTDKTQDPA